MQPLTNYPPQDIAHVYTKLSAYPPSLLNHKSFFYKGINYLKDAHDFIEIEPKSYIRPSKTQAQYGNAYNLLIDNLPNWKDFPKRSNSIILTTSSQTAKNFGISYTVFPLLKANIAICPNSDIWGSFTKSLWKIGLAGKSLKYFNSLIQEIIMWVEGKNITDYDWDFLERTLSVIPGYSGVQKGLSIESNTFLKKVQESGTSIVEFLDVLLHHKTNDFDLVEYSDKINLTDFQNREVWTDSTCILVRNEKVDEIIRKILP